MRMLTVNVEQNREFIMDNSLWFIIIMYITPTNIHRVFVFLYKFYIRHWPNAAENIWDF